jgi:hypothetical protein
MLYGPHTEITLSFSAPLGTMVTIKAELADLSFKRLVPIEEQDCNGARLRAWGVIQEARKLTNHKDHIHFETDGIPSELFKTYSKRWPDAKFRLEFCSADGNFFGATNIVDGKATLYQFDGQSGIGMDRNVVMLQGGSVLEHEDTGEISFFKRTVSDGKQPLQFEVVNRRGEVSKVPYEKVQWKACSAY